MVNKEVGRYIKTLSLVTTTEERDIFGPYEESSELSFCFLISQFYLWLLNMVFSVSFLTRKYQRFYPTSCPTFDDRAFELSQH